MELQLSAADIDAFFRTLNRTRWEKDLAVYDYLQKELRRAHLLPEYQTKFNYFYQVRRNAAWRKKFHALFLELRGKSIDFGDILNEIYRRTKLVEASFASKLAATLDTGLPIIDRHVLSYIGRKLPPSSRGDKERIAAIAALHKEMEESFNAYLRSKPGRHLIKRFRADHPESVVSDMKMLDFVLWQSGGKKKLKKAR